MENRDARETARQEAADLRKDRLPIHQRATVEEQEERIRQAFDDEQRQQRQQRKVTLPATVRRVPVASIAGASAAGIPSLGAIQRSQQADHPGQRVSACTDWSNSSSHVS